MAPQFLCSSSGSAICNATINQCYSSSRMTHVVGPTHNHEHFRAGTPKLPQHRQAASSSVYSPHRQRHVTCRIDLSGDYGSDHLTGKQEESALKEAVQLYDAAQTISNIQVQQELEQAFASDTGPDAGSDSSPLPSRDALVSFWVEQGLSSTHASRLFLELETQGRNYTLQQLSSKVSRWARVLPDTDIAALAFKDSHFLDADVGNGLMNMIRLIEVFPGRDIISMLVKQPRLLWCADLPARINLTMGLLLRIHPSGDVDVVSDIVAEYPELLYRMEYYPEATLMDELPIEIQTMMVVGSSGLSYTLRYYKNRATDYKAELEVHDPFIQNICEGTDGDELDECVP